jgi:carbon storage regulator
MLILSRKEKERIKLGEAIIVTVVRVSGDKVRLGIEAPPDMLVLRDELQPHTPEQAEEARIKRHEQLTGGGLFVQPIAKAG